jgi:hypothetical protein
MPHGGAYLRVCGSNRRIKKRPSFFYLFSGWAVPLTVHSGDQCFGSGFNQVIELGYGFRIRIHEVKHDPQNQKKVKNFMF